MKLNIESSKICVMRERVAGSSGRLHILNGKNPAARDFFAAAVYVSIIANVIMGCSLPSFQLAAVKVSLRNNVTICRLIQVLMMRHRSNLVDHLISLASAPAAPAADVVYYYCDYADQRTLDLDYILGSLLEQLLLKCPIPGHIETQLLQIYARGTRSPAENALSNILCSVVSLHSEIYIVLDGLDECEKPVWQAVLKALRDLGAIAQCVVKVFITCVEEGSVSHHVARYACLQVSPTITTEDIKAFVTSSVRSKIERGELRIRNLMLEHDIIAELISKANGM